MSLKHYRRKLDRDLAKLKHAKQSVRDERETLARLTERHANLAAAQDVLQRVAQGLQQAAHEKIAAVVTRCLASIFGENASTFAIDFQRKRGRTEARLLFKRNGREVSPRSGAGGGVLDVASFALRLACLVLMQPSPRRVLVLDEPFKFVHSPEYRERVRLMLETLSREMDVQFILSTGIEEYQTGKVITIGE